jgi:hypothetical protein
MKAKAQHDAPAYAANRLLGVEESAIRAMMVVDAATWALEATDKGTLVYLPLWPANARVELSLAASDTILNASKSADLSIWADQGEVIDVELALADCRKVIEKGRQNPPPPRQPMRRKSAPVRRK